MENVKKYVLKFKFHILLLGISLFIASQFMKSTLIYTHDGFTHFWRILSTYQEIQKNGRLPIIITRLCNGWGYAPNLFYNPLTTYIPCVFAIFTNNFILAVKLFLCCNIFITAELVYLFSKKISKNENIGFISAVIYILNPYYLGEFFIRGAAGEIAALTFLPLLFLGLYNLVEEDGKKHIYIIVGTVGIALSHNITLVFAAIFSGLYLLFNIKLVIKKYKQLIKYCSIDLLFIVLLTAFYTVPLYLNKTNTDYAIFNSKYMYTNNEFAEENAIKTNELFENIEERMVICKIGWPIIIGCTLLLIFGVEIDKKKLKTIIIFAILGFIGIFMSTEYFPWGKVPEALCILQFPWRLLGFAYLFLSICAAYGMITFVELIFKSKKIVIFISLLIISILSMVYAFKYSGIKIKDKENDEYFESYYTNYENEINYEMIVKDYLPVKAFKKMFTYLPYRDSETVSVIKGRTEIFKQKKDGLKMEIELKPVYDETIIEFPYLYYLGYEAKITETGGKEYKSEVIESENGFVAVRIKNKEIEKIVVEYKTPILYKIAYIVSIVSFVCGLGIIIHNRLKMKK